MTETNELLAAILQRLDLLLAMQAARDEQAEEDREIERENSGESNKILCMGGEIVEVI